MLDAEQDRHAWFEGQPDLDPDRLVFLDETAATTITAALRTTGLVAISMVAGATNGERFGDNVAHTLAPTLTPGDVVVLDNLCVHKVAGVREAVEAAGARLLFLPPCSPDFNPIEQAFAKAII